jgi:hypothetical protein
MRVIKIPAELEAVQFTEAMARGEEPLPRGVRMQSPQYFTIADVRSEAHRVEVEVGDWLVTSETGALELYMGDEFRQLFASCEGRPCLSCGTQGDGGYEVEDGPGPFCSACWEALADHFSGAVVPDVLRAVAELPDRTSPDAQPGLLMVYENELEEILKAAFNEV